MIQNILDFLQKYSLLDKNNTLLVAFSGGVDSLCLLDVLHKQGLNPIAAHLNHNWRGKESKAEEERARTYCKEREIQFYSETLSPDLPQTEEEARNQRYRFLNNIAKQTKATAILTGHTASDNVETILYRIIKGTGIKGLKGIPEVRHQEGLPSIYRPMLALKREDCIQYCKENGLIPNEDPSNYNEKYLRNRTRNSLLPELRTYNNTVDTALLRLSEIASETETIIEEYLADIDLKDFHKQSEPVQRRLLVDLLEEHNIEHTFERVEDLYAFIKENQHSKSGKTHSIGTDLWLFASSKEIKVITKQEPAKLPDLDIRVFSGEVPVKFPAEAENTIFADLSKIKGELSLRTRQPGDIIQPFGMQQKTKLKKYLINRGIPKHQRDNLPLLVNDEEVLWVVGVGMSELLRADKIPTHVITVNYSSQ